ncbi:hypothetical protein DASC09_038150 [Saccharomycopsis crataegensis]|uniref:U1-C C2H2-type zinc finger domain-containing protein n=1 Tax=Saccharomycopsis crataegensis TaxID=43959 RepID=A0AAV5QNJ8_9ASCO|nr:hypothetical protein DASC09_038150 [Saccharomycopsis crataegensis]
MGKYWCTKCSIFVDDSTLGKKTHEASNKHKSSVVRAINSLHKMQREEDKEKSQAEREINRIKNELAFEQGRSSKKREHEDSKSTIIRSKKFAKAQQKPNNDEKDNKETSVISGWVAVKNKTTTLVKSEEKSIEENKTTKGDKFEIKIKESSSVDLNKILEEEETDKKPSLSFKKRGKKKKT